MADDDKDEIALIDRDLVSLYIKYPEMSLAFDDELYHDQGNGTTDSSSEIFSSPASSLVSKSTTRTTPLRPEPQLISSNHEPYDVLLTSLQTADLPSNTHTYYASLGNRILQIGGLLYSAPGVSPTLKDITEIPEHCRTLSAAFQFSSGKVDEQLATLNYVTALAPFNVNPQPEDLWSNFRQMAELLIR